MKIDEIYHAAAYKHVSFGEQNPYSMIKNNIFGTKLCLEAACEAKVETFVLISTDKAVRPTNIMGASKRLAEMYCESLNTEHQTKFIITRFGNVLGSNGSVIPLFKKQLNNGGPITVTHPEVTRFFMTIQEACQLVLEASSMGNGGEIYVFDMGKSIKIIDLAHKMIQLAGLKVNADIEVKFTGLRPGEKMFEETLNKNEIIKIGVIYKGESDTTVVDVPIKYSYWRQLNAKLMAKTMEMQSGQQQFAC